MRRDRAAAASTWPALRLAVEQRPGLMHAAAGKPLIARAGPSAPPAACAAKAHRRDRHRVPLRVIARWGIWRGANISARAPWCLPRSTRSANRPASVIDRNVVRACATDGELRRRQSEAGR